MTTITTHAPGTFSWPELATTDQAAAKTFYAKLFGWEIVDSPMGPGETYTMLKLKGRDVGALYTMRQEERAQNIPPHWNSYVSVTSADQSAARAKSLGGTVLMEPFDVMEHGRMAVIQDPTGAVFCLWQAKKHPGAGVLGEVGALIWTELMTRDAGKARAFYTSLFGWTAEERPMGSVGNYTRYLNQGQPQAGMLQISQEMGAMPSHWLVYFGVADVDGTVGTAQSMGGKVMMPATEVPNVGRFAVLTDPQGAPFAIFKPAQMA